MSLFLFRHDVHDLVLEFGKEEIDNLVFFDGKREEINVLHRLNFAVQLSLVMGSLHGMPGRRDLLWHAWTWW